MNRQSPVLFEAPIAHETPRTFAPHRSQTRSRTIARPGASPSRVYLAFMAAVTSRDWRNAFLNLNGLNMFEMLRALVALNPTTFNDLWTQRSLYSGLINLPRIAYARAVVVNKALPVSAPGDLRLTGQVVTAADFIAERYLLLVLRSIKANNARGPNAVRNMSLILQECNAQGITDKSQIAYVLATAHWESGMGKAMVESDGGNPNYFDKYEPGTKRGRALGNTQPGDGRRYRGRGFVQITGRGHYTRYTRILAARGEAVNLADNPEQATIPRVAAIVLVHGMKHGAFTGKRLAQFGTDPHYDFFNARTIVNGHDRAQLLAGIASAYRAAMN
jgi:hypothetical protein